MRRARRPQPFDARRDANEADRVAFEAARVVDGEPWAGPGVHPGRCDQTLNGVLPPQAIVTTDAGNFCGWVGRGFRLRRPGTFIGPTSGAMGYGLPAAIAASIEHPGRPVVALAGDGGFAMTMTELETAVREARDGDRDRLRQPALRHDPSPPGPPGQRGRGGDRPRPDRLRGGRPAALGARRVRVDDDDAFEPALRDALAAEAPTVIQVTLDRRWKAVGRLDPA